MSQIMLKDMGNSRGSSTNNGGPVLYDVVNTYPWTLTPETKRSGVPSITLIEYEQDIANIWASMSYWYTQSTSMLGNLVNKTESWKDVENPYAALYSAEPTGSTYIFPYFEEYDHNITQNWETTDGIMAAPLANAIAKGIEGLSMVFNSTPGAQINKPKIWKGSGPSSYTINFHLFNTNDTSSTYANVKKNQHLKRRLQMAALHDQRNAILISPPALFVVDIPGIRYSPAAIISNLVVANVGQMNSMTLDAQPENIPDAYKISITITELITESRQLLDSSITGSKITAIKQEKKLNNEQVVGQVGAKATADTTNDSNFIRSGLAAAGTPFANQ